MKQLKQLFIYWAWCERRLISSCTKRRKRFPNDTSSYNPQSRQNIASNKERELHTFSRDDFLLCPPSQTNLYGEIQKLLKIYFKCNATQYSSF